MRPLCSQCQHYTITWDKNHPWGCRAYGFITHRLPSLVVKETTGKECMAFSAKKTIKKREKRV